MRKFSLFDAKTHFSQVINLVEHNEEVMISRHGKVIAKIIPFSENSSGVREFGRLRGKIKISKDFDATLPGDILDAFYNEKE
jgi:prevent-host-death family protein